MSHQSHSFEAGERHMAYTNAYPGLDGINDYLQSAYWLWLLVN